MIYLQPHKRPYQRVAQALGVAGGVLVVALIAVQIFAPHFFPAVFMSVAQPFWRTEFAVTSGSLRSPEALLRENELLLLERTDAQVRLDTVRAVEAENEELKILLGRLPQPVTMGTTTDGAQPVFAGTGTFAPGSRILAAVLKRPPFSPYDEFIIDIGADQGVTASTSVYAAGNVLIGHIVDVLDSTSKVRLFSSPGEQYEVLIGPAHIPATAVGRGGGQYEAQVSRDSSVNEGDFVLNSALSDRPFGIVSAVISDPAQTFVTILFAPPVNIYDIRWVLVENQ